MHDAWQALGNADLLTQDRRPGAEHARSLFIVRPVGAGETIRRDHVRAIRPGMGLPPRTLPSVLGRRARRDLGRGEPLRWEDIEWTRPASLQAAPSVGAGGDHCLICPLNRFTSAHLYDSTARIPYGNRGVGPIPR